MTLDGRERQFAATPVSRHSTLRPFPAKVGFLAPPRTHAVGHNRSYRQPKDRIATDRFTRYCGHRPSSVRGVEIPKAAVRCLSMPKTRRPSAAHDVERALPTQRRRRRFSGRMTGPTLEADLWRSRRASQSWRLRSFTRADRRQRRVRSRTTASDVDELALPTQRRRRRFSGRMTGRPSEADLRRSRRANQSWRLRSFTRADRRQRRARSRTTASDGDELALPTLMRHSRWGVRRREAAGQILRFFAATY
jgi:hypothetical protein